MKVNSIDWAANRTQLDNQSKNINYQKLMKIMIAEGEVFFFSVIQTERIWKPLCTFKIENFKK